MYVHGFTTAENVVKDLATVLTTGDIINPSNNWELVYPTELSLVTNEAVFKVSPFTDKVWVKKEVTTVSSGKITLANDIVPGGGTRVFVKDKKYYLYLKKDNGDPDVMEYKITGSKEITVHTTLEGKTVIVDYEKPTNITSTYYVKIRKPDIISGTTPNNHFIDWVIGENYDQQSNSFPVDHYSETGKISWFRETENSFQIAKPWLPIEYWISFDKNAAVGVLMGDVGLSVSDWLSSPFYFGSLKQIDGALETDLRGNFGGFGGSYTEPVLSKRYGDYTGTGMTDVIMVATKTGRPYQAHKVQIFTGYEFREKTFNGQSLHTGKHAVSEIVLADVHENDRGILRHCLAVPRVAKEHGTELIYNRYISGEEETYIFLNINAPYTPFNTSPDVLIGIAIRTDI